jgi:hypothetical protein
MPSEFDSDTTLEQVGERRYGGHISDRWNAPLGPIGGYVLAVATRALCLESGKPDPLTVTGHFVGRTVPGEVEIEVEPVRRGKRHSTSMATLRQGGEERLRVLGTFADLGAAEGRTLVDNAPPDLPALEECIDPVPLIPEAMAAMVSVAQRFTVRSRPGTPGWLHAGPSGRASQELWLRFVDGREADPLALVLIVDGTPPTVLELGEVGSITVELTVHVRGRPEPGWLRMRKSARHLIDGYFEEDAEVWDSSDRLVAQSRQLAMLVRIG